MSAHVFRRRRRQQPPVLIAPLDRLGELIERVVTLLDEVPAPESPSDDAAAVEAGHVLFVPGRDGYALVLRDGAVPGLSEPVALAGANYRVARLGPSPLPGDRRRCAFLEQERRLEDRTPTGARGEPDRRDAGGPAG